MRRARLEAAEAETLVVDSSKPEVTYVTFSFADALQADWLFRNGQITWSVVEMIFIEYCRNKSVFFHSENVVNYTL